MELDENGMMALLHGAVKRATWDARKGDTSAQAFLEYLRTGQDPAEATNGASNGNGHASGAAVDHEAQFVADTGRTVEEFAAAVGISAKVLRASWAGTTPEGERLERRRRLADALGVNEKYLPEGTENG